MRKRELLGEMRAASAAITPADVDELVAAGVAPENASWLIGVTRISHIPDTGLYEPDDEVGAWAFITPIRVEDAATPESRDPERCVRHGDIIDLVAWDTSAPHEWALRAGLAGSAGCVEPQYLDPEPVRVHRSILAWFRAGCRGVVPLSRDPAATYRLLMGFPGGIIAEDGKHAGELARILERPWPLPEIIVAPPEAALAPR